MYQIKCDDFYLYDYRLPELIVTNPKVSIATNTVGSASFVIHSNHPHYPQLKVLKSIFEISDEFGVLFRGRMTSNSKDFYNSKAVDLEGLMAFFNDSIVRPFKFPGDFVEDAGYIAASQNGNVIEFFLSWLILNHNSQVQDFQKFKLGNVTVKDPNNYITRSESKYANTWEILKSKLFDSSLGGHLCIRYEADGNYIDYLEKFELTNTQEITYSENLVDLKEGIEATDTFTAVIPLGAEIETGETNENGEAVKETLTLSGIDDGEVAPGIMKVGDTLYSTSAVDSYGWIYAPIEESTMSDVTVVQNLLTKGIALLTGEGVKLKSSIEIYAVDLHFNDAEIRSFRPYRNTKVNSLPHGQNALLPLTSLEIDLFNPQGTKIVLGSTQKTLSEVTNDRIQGAIDYTKESTDALAGKLSSTQQEVKSTLTNYQTEIEHTKETVGIMASKAYVEKSTFEEYKEETATEFAVNAEAVNMKFTRTTEQIRNLDNDLQAKLEKYARYFKFTLNGLVIGGGTNAITLSIDNEGGLVFSKNGIPFGWWDGVDFRTGNIVVAVNERAQFGNFAFVPRSSGSLSFLKVKGSNASGAQHTHSYTEAITKAATCTETGVKAYMCSCGHSYTETISATGHNYNEVVTPPTDTERGYTTHTCSNCGDKYVDSYIDPKAKAISIGVVYPEWGTVSVNGAEATNTVKQYYFNDGDTVTLTAYPNDAFSFWYDSNGAVKSYANPYTFVVGEDTADALYAT